MAQEASRRPLTEEAQVCGWVSPCGICSGQSRRETFLSPRYSFSPVNRLSFQRGSPLSYIIWGTNNRLVDVRSSGT
jgi:hypothetical protein